MTKPSVDHSDEFTFKEKIQYTLLGFLVLGGSFFIGRSMIRKLVTTNEEKKTFLEGNPALFAQQIRLAFENDGYGWWHPDIAALRDVLISIPSVSMFQKVNDSYQRLYNRSLMLDMKNGLKTSEYNEMIAILSVKPSKGNVAAPLQLSIKQYQSWAQRLKDAFDLRHGIFPGTDRPAIKAVFMEVPTQSAFQQLAAIYKAMYSADLDSDLRGELHFWEYPNFMKIISEKPNY